MAKKEREKRNNPGNLPIIRKLDPAVENALLNLAADSPAGGKFINLRRTEPGFKMGEEVAQELTNCVVTGVDMYWSAWIPGPDGKLKLDRVPIEDEPPDTRYSQRCDVALQCGNDDAILSLPPSGSRSFAGFAAKLKKAGLSVVGATINVGSKIVSTSYGPLNVPIFHLAAAAVEDVIQEDDNEELPTAWR